MPRSSTSPAFTAEADQGPHTSLMCLHMKEMNIYPAPQHVEFRARALDRG